MNALKQFAVLALLGGLVAFSMESDAGTVTVTDVADVAGDIDTWSITFDEITFTTNSNPGRLAYLIFEDFFAASGTANGGTSKAGATGGTIIVGGVSQSFNLNNINGQSTTIDWASIDSNDLLLNFTDEVINPAAGVEVRISSVPTGTLVDMNGTPPAITSASTVQATIWSNSSSGTIQTDTVTVSVGNNPDSGLSLQVETDGNDLVFTWPSQSGKVYDLLYDDGGFGTEPTDNWPVYLDNLGIGATPPTNTLTLPFPAEDKMFFVLRERNPPIKVIPIKVILMGGQSNMVGIGTVVSDLPAALQGEQTDILFIHQNTTSLTSLQPGGGQQYGPEITFGRTVADANPSETFAIIKYASGGTDLENDWDPATGPSYSAFRAKVTAGMNALTTAGYTPEIAGMLWTQGERDARQGFGASYEANLNAFIADVRSRYGEGLPFFISQLSSLQTDLPATGLAQVRQAQANVAAADANSHLIVTDSFGMGTDNLHFSSAGQISLGQAFAASFQANAAAMSEGF